MNFLCSTPRYDQYLWSFIAFALISAVISATHSAHPVGESQAEHAE
jgi:hypothetical protein